MLTLNLADFRPLFLLHHSCFHFAAKPDMVDVIQHDTHYASGEVLQPVNTNYLTKLWEGSRSQM